MFVHSLGPAHGWRLPVAATAIAAAMLLSGGPTGDDRPASAARVAPGDSTALVALGDSIFHGRSGGAICASCHGMNAKGVRGIGPDLTDATWLHGDGSTDFLMKVIRSGVTAPKKSPAMMPPFGGTPLDDRQLRALAFYIRAIGAKK